MPTNADLPPSLLTATATLAGAPPGALRKPLDSARETPASSGTKSINISPKETTRGSISGFVSPLIVMSGSGRGRVSSRRKREFSGVIYRKIGFDVGDKNNNKQF